MDFNDISLDKIKDFLANKAYRTYTIFLSAALIVVLIMSFLIILKFPEFARTSGEINDLNSKIDQLNSRVKKLDVLSKKTQKLRMEVDIYSKGIPAQKDIPQLLEELSIVAKSSGVKILSITPSKLETVKAGKKAKAYYREMPITITAQSGYHQLGSFISSLEEGKRFVTIEQLRIQGDASFLRNHKVKMVLKTYVAM